MTSPKKKRHPWRTPKPQHRPQKPMDPAQLERWIKFWGGK